MKRSADEQVQQFLEDLEAANSEKHSLLQELRKIVFEINPAVGERMMYGGIMFSLGRDFGGVFVSRNHISFEFGNGATFDDPDGLLEGTGKLRRHVKIKSRPDVTDKQVRFFIKQSLTLI